jgi:hypothetical protein
MCGEEQQDVRLSVFCKYGGDWCALEDTCRTVRVCRYASLWTLTCYSVAQAGYIAIDNTESMYILSQCIVDFIVRSEATSHMFTVARRGGRAECVVVWTSVALLDWARYGHGL